MTQNSGGESRGLQRTVCLYLEICLNTTHQQDQASSERMSLNKRTTTAKYSPFLYLIQFQLLAGCRRIIQLDYLPVRSPTSPMGLNLPNAMTLPNASSSSCGLVTSNHKIILFYFIIVILCENPNVNV